MLNSRRLFALGLLLASVAQAGIGIDASVAPVAPQPLPFVAGGRAPGGAALEVNNRYFTRDGQPWFPIMGEFHYARYPEAEWETELLKIKAGGVDVVATYVFWIFHEERQGQFDWQGQRNLRKFVELCGRHGLYVWLRIGPWDHGEARNGGFPDWLVAAGPVRGNDPGYLGHVRTFFNQIGEQVRGQLWRDGGPIVGVQLENEYHPEKDGEAHMTKLLELARGAGLETPFYTATGWDKAVIPATPFLPVFGGYTEQFWSDRRTELLPNQNFFFTTIRAEDNVSYLLVPKDQAYHERYVDYPFLTAEMGAGMAIAYHRRPVMQAADSAAAALVKLGSGITLLGYYMYHGGTNPDAHGPVHESFSGWNAYNELETKSYDFQAPIGEFGRINDTYRALKRLHLFVHDFGAQFAPMGAYFPAETPRSLDDVITPRVALRSDGRAGFVFINNHQRSHPLPAQRDFQVTVKLAAGSVTLPHEPITIPAGAYVHWPINFAIGGATLRSATVQPVCRLADENLYVFTAEPGIAAELVIVAPADTQITSAGRVSSLDGGTLVTDLNPGRAPAVTLRAADGRVTTLLVLSREDGLNLWKGKLLGRERLLISRASVRFEDETVALESEDADALRIAMYPGLEQAGAASDAPMSAVPIATTGLFTEYATSSERAAAPKAALWPLRTAAPAAAVRVNPDPKRAVALEPNDADFERAAVWSIRVPDDAVDGDARRLLRVHYVGDVARLYAGDRLLVDNFFKGTPLEYALWRLTPAERRAGLTLKVLPLRRDAPIYLPRGAWPKFDGKGEALEVGVPEIVPIYQATLGGQ